MGNERKFIFKPLSITSYLLRTVEGGREPPFNGRMCTIQKIFYTLHNQHCIYEVGPVIPN